eukprot:1252236-Alexandrium_andersonii.AAC.1
MSLRPSAIPTMAADASGPLSGSPSPPAPLFCPGLCSRSPSDSAREASVTSGQLSASGSHV